MKRRIDEAAKYVPLDQLCLSPQCGFSSTVEGNVLTYDDEVAKLRLIVEVAGRSLGLIRPAIDQRARRVNHRKRKRRCGDEDGCSDPSYSFVW